MTKIQEIKSDFKDTDLFNLAFTHRSWVNENDSPLGTNERLEFLGDAVLEFVVSQYIYNKFPQKDEGFLTYLRSRVVDTKNLAEAAKNLGVADNIFLSKGEENSGGRSNPAILANTVEAIIGAIYLDQGLENAKKFIDENILFDISDKLQKPLKDPKSRLQEAVQAMGKMAPKYRVLSESGPDHDPTFKVGVYVENKEITTGTGKSKLKAEQSAAELALAKIEQKK